MKSFLMHKEKSRLGEFNTQGACGKQEKQGEKARNRFDKLK